MGASVATTSTSGCSIFVPLVRIRIDRFEIDCREIVQSDLAQAEHVLVRLVEALTASTSGFRVASYLVDLQLHGDVVGVDRNEYLGRYVRNAPDLGPSLGSGWRVLFWRSAWITTQNCVGRRVGSGAG